MTIDILGKDVVVSKDPILSRDWDANGSYCGNACAIKIDSSTPRDRQRSTLIHEILECVNYDLEMKMDHGDITRLETGLFQVMKSNGGMGWIDSILDKAK